MKRLTASEARDNFAETINQVAYRGERIIIHRRGKALVAVVPVSDLQALEKLEDQLDVEAAKRALAESDEHIPYDKVRRELGLEK